MSAESAAGCKIDLAIRMSTSQYTLFLDADDFYGPVYVAAMVNAMHGANADFTVPQQVARVDINTSGAATNIGPSKASNLLLSRAQCRHARIIGLDSRPSVRRVHATGIQEQNAMTVCGHCVGVRRETLRTSKCVVRHSWQWDGKLHECLRSYYKKNKRRMRFLAATATRTGEKLDCGGMTKVDWSKNMNKQYMYPFVADETLEPEDAAKVRAQGAVLAYLMARHAGKTVDETADSYMCKGISYIDCAKFIEFKKDVISFTGKSTCAHSSFQACEDFHHKSRATEVDWDQKKVALREKAHNARFGG